MTEPIIVSNVTKLTDVALHDVKKDELDETKSLIWFLKFDLSCFCYCFLFSSSSFFLSQISFFFRSPFNNLYFLFIKKIIIIIFSNRLFSCICIAFVWRECFVISCLKAWNCWRAKWLGRMDRSSFESRTWSYHYSSTHAWRVD